MQKPGGTGKPAEAVRPRLKPLPPTRSASAGRTRANGRMSDIQTGYGWDRGLRSSNRDGFQGPSRASDRSRAIWQPWCHETKQMPALQALKRFSTIAFHLAALAK